MGFFLRKIACIETRNDAHPLRRAAFLLPLPRKGCAYYYTIVFQPSITVPSLKINFIFPLSPMRT